MEEPYIAIYLIHTLFSGLKLIVKLCGDQGLSETTAWSRELQRAQARLKQKEQGCVYCGHYLENS